jgi:SAM-dependent methyltransferase
VCAGTIVFCVRALEIAQALQRQDADSRSSQTRIVERPSVQTAPSTANFDYLGFENRFRGPEAVIRERLQHHVSRLQESYPVLDLGCGRGELLALLAEAGVPASGVDSDRAMAEAARQRGLTVTTGDLFEVLEAIEPASLGALTAFHVIEHMDLASQVRLVRSARTALRPGGVLILETPSPLSLVAGSINFLRDPTHVRPLHPDTLAYIVESEGFTHAEIELLAAVPAASRVPRVEANSERDDQINAALDVIDEVLFGHQDFAVVGPR